MMSDSPVLQLLLTLPASRGFDASRGMMRCPNPEHAGGAERTPSFKVTLDGPYAGSHYCFGCKCRGPWAKTIELLGFPPEARFLTRDVVSDPFADSDAEAMLGRRRRLEGRDASFRERWPRDQDWRGVPGRLLVDVGATMVFSNRSKDAPLLRLPAMVLGRERGYIDCVIEPGPDDKLKYINSSAVRGWSRDVLFPYDYVRSLSPRVMAVVEGPRDALVSITCGLPALATLGATSWSPACVRLVEAVAPDLLLIMGDPDEAGVELMREVHHDLHAKMATRIVMLPSKFVVNSLGLRVRKKLMDPGDLTPRRLERLMEKLGVEGWRIER